MTASSEVPTNSVESTATGPNSAETESLRTSTTPARADPVPDANMMKTPPVDIPVRKSRDGSTTSGTRHPSVEVDTSKPKDFDGEVKTNNSLPTQEQIQRIEEYVVLDKYGKTHTFKSLYNGKNVARRVLVVFIRHFFCGVSSNRRL